MVACFIGDQSFEFVFENSPPPNLFHIFATLTLNKEKLLVVCLFFLFKIMIVDVAINIVPGEVQP